MARAKYDEVSLEEAIDTFFQKDSYLPWFDHSHFDDRCLDCAGSGWEEYFDDDYFCPIYLYWEWGTLENKYRPCRTCHQTDSLLHAVNLEHSHTGVESYLGSKLRQVLKKAGEVDKQPLPDDDLSDIFRQMAEDAHADPELYQ